MPDNPRLQIHEKKLIDSTRINDKSPMQIFYTNLKRYVFMKVQTGGSTEYGVESVRLHFDYKPLRVCQLTELSIWHFISCKLQGAAH